MRSPDMLPDRSTRNPTESPEIGIPMNALPSGGIDGPPGGRSGKRIEAISCPTKTTIAAAMASRHQSERWRARAIETSSAASR